MGALAARDALNEKPDHGPSAASSVAGLVTIGAPNLGSFVEGAFTAHTTGEVSAGIWKVVYGSLGVACRVTEGTIVAALKDMCGWLTNPVSEGALAMRPGSQELGALPRVPDSVPVLAVAGQLHLKSKLLWGLSVDVDKTKDLGDLLVRRDSASRHGGLPAIAAVDGHPEPLVVDCDVNLEDLAVLGDLTWQFLVGQLGWTGCTHGGLLFHEQGHQSASRHRCALVSSRAVVEL